MIDLLRVTLLLVAAGGVFGGLPARFGWTRRGRRLLLPGFAAFVLYLLIEAFLRVRP